ncbi:carotenoid oxygenase family protein [Streptosporangium sp. NPDC006007]|uniref:carotenoid oxygenase family protein n=1 Tax=Streptosporangium sp. NPDC006007 TaxID=3154575 RepID=UPI0033B5AF1F
MPHPPRITLACRRRYDLGDPRTATRRWRQLRKVRETASAARRCSGSEGRLGRAGRLLYTVFDDAVVKYDTETGVGQVKEVGGRPGEAIFVPAAGAETEDGGWLLSIVTDHSGDGSRLLVLDAAGLDLVASVRLPRRVPSGFHGSWMADR